MSSLIDSMKERIKNSGANKKEVFYIAPDAKRRIRFLQELDEGYEFKFHSHWNKGINALCAEEYGKDCPYCGDSDEEMKEYTNYAFSVFDYDANDVKILLYKATGLTPLPAFIEFFDEYGTIMDRDYTIKKSGKGMSGNITVLPGERSTFRNKKAKPYTKKQIIKILQTAFPVNDSDMYDEDDEDEDEKPKKNKKAEKKTKKKEKTIEEKLLELDIDDLKNIAIELGISKKELKNLDEEEIVETLIDDNDEDDLVNAYNDYIESLEDEDDDEDEEEDEE